MFHPSRRSFLTTAAAFAASSFFVTPGAFDTRRLKDGAYELTVTASDTAGNHSSSSQIFSVHNRSGWLKG